MCVRYKRTCACLPCVRLSTRMFVCVYISCVHVCMSSVCKRVRVVSARVYITRTSVCPEFACVCLNCACVYVLCNLRAQDIGCKRSSAVTTPRVDTCVHASVRTHATHTHICTKHTRARASVHTHTHTHTHTHVSTHSPVRPRSSKAHHPEKPQHPALWQVARHFHVQDPQAVQPRQRSQWLGHLRCCTCEKSLRANNYTFL